MELKSTLSQLRKKKGLTQQELADRLHVSRQTVSRWEVGVSIPTLENLVYLSQLYQIPLERLAQGELEQAKPASAPSKDTGGPKLHIPYWYLAFTILGLALLAGAAGFHQASHTTERSCIMDIISAVRAGVYQPARSAAARTTQSTNDSFTKQVERYYGVSGNGDFTVILSPYLKLRMDYNRWKEAQPPQEDIPDPMGGPTEENMAYLRARYSGDLTMFYRMEALDTMSDMGIITREQYNFFYNLREMTWSAGTAEIRSGPLEEGVGNSKMAHLEEELYRLSPLAKSLTLDDLFSWLTNEK